MKWVKVLDQDTLTEGERLVLDIEGHKILLLKHRAQIYAILNACPHMGVSLKRGKIENDSIVCPFHRSVFDLETGEVKEWAPWPPVVGPMMGAVKQEHALQVYPTRIENNAVWIGLDDAA